MKTKTGRISAILALAAAFIVSAAGFATSFRQAGAADDASAVINAARAQIRGIDASYDEDFRPLTGTSVYANELSMSWNEAQEAGQTTSNYAIFEYVLEEGYDGAAVPGVHWGDGMLLGYNNIVSQGCNPGYNAAQSYQSFTGGTNSPLTDTANAGKRIFIILNRAVAGAYSLHALDVNEEPVFGADTWGYLYITNGTVLTKFNQWAGIINGTAVAGTSAPYNNIPDMRMCGFTFGGGTATISDLKCYDETGKDLGIVFSGYDITTENLDDHADDEYWTTFSPSDTKIVDPVNWNYTSSAGVEVTRSFNGSEANAGGQQGAGFYSRFDSTFTEDDFGFTLGNNVAAINDYVFTPSDTGSVLVLNRWAQGHRKEAMEFGKTINVNEVDSVTFRIWGDQLVYHNIRPSNAIMLFNLADTETDITDASTHICLNNYVPKEYAETCPDDFIEIAVPSEALAVLADENGDINGFQIVMTNGAGFSYFLLDYIKINPVYNVSYEADGGAHENPATWSLGDGEVTLLPAVKENYDFVGWYASSDFAEESKVTVLSAGTVTSDLTLYAKYEKTEYTVTFTSNADVDIDPISVAWGETIPEPTPPEVINMTFVKWMLDGEDYTFGEMPAHDITVHALYEGETFDITVTNAEHGTANILSSAKYMDEVVFTVSADSGYQISAVTVKAGDEDVTVYITDDGYRFIMPASDVAVSYGVTLINYRITYVGAEGIVNSNPIEFSVESPVTFADVQKEGFVFGGWYTDEACTERITSTEGLTSDITVYALFTEEESGCNSSADGLFAGGMTLLAGAAALLIVRKRRGANK